MRVLYKLLNLLVESDDIIKKKINAASSTNASNGSRGSRSSSRQSKRDAQAISQSSDILGQCANTSYVKESYSRQRCPRRCSKSLEIFCFAVE